MFLFPTVLYFFLCFSFFILFSLLFFFSFVFSLSFLSFFPFPFISFPSFLFYFGFHRFPPLSFLFYPSFSPLSSFLFSSSSPILSFSPSFLVFLFLHFLCELSSVISSPSLLLFLLLLFHLPSHHQEEQVSLLVPSSASRDPRMFYLNVTPVPPRTRPFSSPPRCSSVGANKYLHEGLRTSAATLLGSRNIPV